MAEWDDSQKRPSIFFKDTYEEVLERVSFLSLSDDVEKTTPQSSMYLLVDDDDSQRVLGFYWLRHHLNFRNHAQVGGHI